MSLYEQGRDAPKTSLSGYIGMLVLCLVVGGIGVAVYSGLTASEDPFNVGDCLVSEENKYERAGCDEQEAEFEVYATRSVEDECVDVPGTSEAYYETSRGTDWYCIGDKNTDISRAVNGIDTDDCVIVNESGSAEKAPCGTDGSRPVLKVLERVPKMDVAETALSPSACAREGVEEADLTYSWGLERRGTNDSLTIIDSFSWDRVLCLGVES